MTRQSATSWPEAYAEVGWRVFPLEPGGKRPVAGCRWREWATTDPATLRRWFPDDTCNVGVVTGEAFDAFDIEAAYVEPFLAWARGRRMPRTPVAWTGRGGIHVLVTPTGRATTRLRLGGLHIGELKGVGGYIVVAPSVTERPYRWLMAPRSLAVAPAADWLLGLVEPPPEVRPAGPLVRTTAEARRCLEVLARFVARAPAGDRNAALYWATCRAVEAGCPPQATTAAMTRAAVALAGDDGDKAVAATIASALRHAVPA